MNCKQYVMFFAAIITASSTAEAQEVYKNVSPKGSVEFSDRPSPGAKAVDVSPNVVDVVPVKPIKPSPPISAKATDAPEGSGQPEVVPEDVSNGYYGDAGNRREKLQELKERREQGGQPTTLPANRKPEKAAVHGSAPRR